MDLEINCLGPAPMRGYVGKPVGAQPGTLPIIINCRAAGIKGGWCRCSVNECVGNAAHSDAEIYCEIGLIDTTCPPSAVWSSLNVARGKKTVTCVPYRTHGWPEGYWRPLWEQDYLKPRKDFIANYLK